MSPFSADPRTLLYSLVVINLLMTVSLAVAAGGAQAGRRREGIARWTVAVETATWVLVAARGAIPDLLSIVAANGAKAAVHALALTAIHEFQRRPCPRWKSLVPVALAVVAAAACIDDIRARFLWTSLVFGGQLALIAHTLATHADSRESRAGRLLLAGARFMVVVCAARAALAASGHGRLELPFAGMPAKAAGRNRVEVCAGCSRSAAGRRDRCDAA